MEDNVTISPNVVTIYSRSTGEKVGGTVIGRGSHIGIAAVIGPSLKIAPNSVIDAQAFVSKDITEAGFYIGVPAVKKR